NPRLARDRLRLRGGRAGGPREVSCLEQPVHDRSARSRIEACAPGMDTSRSAILLEPEHSFQVEAITASPQLAERGVAERAALLERMRVRLRVRALRRRMRAR